MKKVITLFVYLLLFVLGFSQKWYAAHAPHGRDICASAIPTDQTFILGAGFEIAEQFEDYYYTNDYALSGGGWNVPAAESPTSIVKSIAFVDSMNGFAVSYRGKLSKTISGGVFWNKVDTFANRNFYKIISLTPQVLFIAGGSRYTDTLGVLKDTAAILKSTDGGVTWLEVYHQPGKAIKSVCFIDNQKGFAVGDSSQILTTDDAGNTWQPVNTPVAGRDLNGIFFPSQTTGYIIGGLRDSMRTLLKTTNAGLSWTVVTDEVGGGLNDVTFFNPSTGYIVGDSGTVLKTTDGGSSWQPLLLPEMLPDQRLMTVTFRHSDLGIIAGMGGALWFYTHSAVPEIQPLGVTMTDSVTANIYSSVNTHGAQAALTVICSTDSLFTTVIGITYSAPVRSDSFAIFSYSTFGNPLQPDTTYYYLIQVVTLDTMIFSPLQSFVARQPNYTFQTNMTSNHTAHSATLSGTVNHLPSATHLYFEYGSSPVLGNIMNASPALITDGQEHQVSAVLSGLSPYVLYYYRLKGMGANNELYLSNTVSFFLGEVFGQLQTLPVSMLVGTYATLNGSIKNCVLPGLVSFEYDTSEFFIHPISTAPQSIADSAEHTFSAPISGLQQLRVYYCRIKLQTSLGTFFGNTVSFAPGIFTSVETGNAANGTTTSVTLTGTVEGFKIPAQLSFEYGANNLLLNQTVAALPDSVSDSLRHTVSVPLNNLSGATVFYRLVATTAFGKFYGSTLSYNPAPTSQNLIKLYPNPTSSSIVVELTYPFSTELTIDLIDAAGRKYKAWQIAPYLQTFVLQLPEVNAGVYLLKLQAVHTLITRQLVIVK